MSGFTTATEIQPQGDLAYSTLVPDGWQQGRGAFGGLVLGVLARAMIAAEPDATRQLRALTGDICAPVLPGPARIDVTLLRRGNNLTNLDARLLQGDAVLARASCALSVPRKVTHPLYTQAPPRDAEWAQGTELAHSPFWPTFTQHYRYRLLSALPFSGASEPRIDGFVREHDRHTPLDAPAVIALLDSYWPALFAIETQPRMAATVSFAAQLFADPRTLDGDTPLRYRSELVALRDGFLLENRELWHEQRLIALNQQTMAVLA